MRKEDVKRQEPEVYLLACQLQIHLALTWTACVLIARDMLTGHRFIKRDSVESLAEFVPCGVCHNPIAKGSAVCPHCCASDADE